MIIEIKGLPDGHKIKHINVDITFADGSCVVKTHAEPSHVQNVEHIVQNVSHAVQGQQDRHDDDDHREVIAAPSITAPNNNIDTRPKKEIPPEMVDIEF
jgi:hypothetical protein